MTASSVEESRTVGEVANVGLQVALLPAMTRAFQTSRARHITQPITIIRPRDPTIRTLGFTCFRALPIGNAEFMVVAFSDRKNAMAAFVDLGR